MKAKKVLKPLISLMISFIILNGICFFYYNVPVHSESESNSTDYVWEKSKFYSRGTEGFAWGSTDANGFNNISTDDSNSPEVLIMGTSHTEAFNVLQKESYAYLFNELADKSDMDMNAYNIGISGHRITTNLNNFESALKEFTPRDYVVMEVNKTEFSSDEITQILNGTVEKNHSSANPVLVFLQKIPLLRCVYFQLDNLGVQIKNIDNNATKAQSSQKSVQQTADNDESYTMQLDNLFEKISKTASDNGVKLIIVYNSKLYIDKNGKVIPQQTNEKTKAFETVCNNNGIVFLNMYNAFADYYNDNRKMPHGFFNTAVGEGHLNKYGHEVIASELYKLIMDLENQN